MTDTREALTIGNTFFYVCHDEGGPYYFGRADYTTTCPWHGDDCSHVYLMADPDKVKALL